MLGCQGRGRKDCCFLTKESAALGTYGLLFSLAYVFLLSVPSEALLLRARVGEYSMNLEGDEVVVSLKRQKNMPGGSVLRRRCRCKESPLTCPVHVAWPAVRDVTPGGLIFAGIGANAARCKLREMLSSLRVRDAQLYWTHDLRRGHAKDLQLSGTRPSCRMSLSDCFCHGQAPRCLKSCRPGSGEVPLSCHNWICIFWTGELV